MNNEKPTINRYCNWLDNQIHTGIVNLDTDKEFILSGYYEDETGNRHFTHQQAQLIVACTPDFNTGWIRPDFPDHKSHYLQARCLREN